MLLSTRVPTESAMPPSDMMLSDTPSASSTPKEPSTATGKVVLQDPQTRRTATGDVADYDLATRTVTVTGNPVALSDHDGNLVKGRRLLYEVDGGAMKVLSEVK